jgi:hypothetical protein
VTQAGQQAGQQADEVARAAGRQLGTASDELRQQAQATADAAGRQLERLGAPESVRRPAQAAVDSAAGAATRVAEGLGQSGTYLQEQGATGLLDDLAGVVRRHPWPVLGVVAAFAALLALVLWRRR